jgi:hypothetical protein
MNRIDLTKQGPFPNQIDPWSEAAHYFQSLHNEMIGAPLAGGDQRGLTRTISC